MSSINSLLLTLCLIPTCVFATAYYETTSPTGEVTIQPFFSLSPSAGTVVPCLFGGGVAFILTLFLLFLCSGRDRTLPDSDLGAVLKEDEEEPIVPEPTKNATAKKTRRDVCPIDLFK
jgi:hypothetical protein